VDGPFAFLQRRRKAELGKAHTCGTDDDDYDILFLLSEARGLFPNFFLLSSARATPVLLWSLSLPFLLIPTFLLLLVASF
jgi:hypothetical protein